MCIRDRSVSVLCKDEIEVIKGAPFASEDLMCINKRTRINNANKTEIAFIEFVLPI